jgi:two-component system, OmpR family, response regulator BaeR
MSKPPVLPRAVSSLHDDAAPASSTRPMVVIVEDEVKIAAVLAVYLHAAGYATHHLSDGLAVAPYVRAHPPQLILLDLAIPHRTGVEVCQELRLFTAVPIIMVTARAQEVDLLLGLEVGGDDYICKPFSPREVVARVRAVLRRMTVPTTGQPAQSLPSTDRSGPAPRSIGPFAIDDECMRITLRGNILDVTPTEFKLLRKLLLQAGRVFSRVQLLAEIHGQDDLTFDRAIDSHIKNIRKRLGADAKMLRSIYGVGYQFNLDA